MDKDPKMNEELKRLEETSDEIYFRMQHSLNLGNDEDYKTWSEEYLRVRKEIKAIKSKHFDNFVKCVEIAAPFVGLAGTVISSVCKLNEARAIADAYRHGYEIVTDYEKSGEIPWKEATRIVHKLR